MTFDPIFVETIKEQILSIPDVRNNIDNTAQEWVDHFEKNLGRKLDQEVRDELFCQYQVQLMNRFFLNLAHL